MGLDAIGTARCGSDRLKAQATATGLARCAKNNCLISAAGFAALNR
jgi:hypothetical protein